MEPIPTNFSFDFTITVSVILAICALISPIITAIINNIHHTKIRKMELEYDKKSLQTKLIHEALIHQSDIYYADKKEAFADFLKTAGAFSMRKQSQHDYDALHSSIDKALLFCNEVNQSFLCEFQNYIDTQAFGSTYSPNERTEYSRKLNEIALSLSEELDSSKPVIEYN